MSTIALLDIPKPKMAQAAGLFNTIRQIGGSFGIAILGTLLIKSVNFHHQIYGEQLNISSPVFQNTVHHLKNFAMYAGGSTPALATLQAKAIIMKHVVAEVFVQGINDDFFVGAILTFFLIIPPR